MRMEICEIAKNALDQLLRSPGSADVSVSPSASDAQSSHPILQREMRFVVTRPTRADTLTWFFLHYARLTKFLEFFGWKIDRKRHTTTGSLENLRSRTREFVIPFRGTLLVHIPELGRR